MVEVYDNESIGSNGYEEASHILPEEEPDTTDYDAFPELDSKDPKNLTEEEKVAVIAGTNMSEQFWIEQSTKGKERTEDEQRK